MKQHSSQIVYNSVYWGLQARFFKSQYGLKVPPQVHICHDIKSQYTHIKYTFISIFNHKSQHKAQKIIVQTTHR